MNKQYKSAMAGEFSSVVGQGYKRGKSHHDPDYHYGSLSSHKKWANKRMERPHKALQNERGLNKIMKLLGISL